MVGLQSPGRQPGATPLCRGYEPAANEQSNLLPGREITISTLAGLSAVTACVVFIAITMAVPESRLQDLSFTAVPENEGRAGADPDHETVRVLEEQPQHAVVALAADELRVHERPRQQAEPGRVPTCSPSTIVGSSSPVTASPPIEMAAASLAATTTPASYRAVIAALISMSGPRRAACSDRRPGRRECVRARDLAEDLLLRGRVERPRRGHLEELRGTNALDLLPHVREGALGVAARPRQHERPGLRAAGVGGERRPHRRGPRPPAEKDQQPRGPRSRRLLSHRHRLKRHPGDGGQGQPAQANSRLGHGIAPFVSRAPPTILEEYYNRGDVRTDPGRPPLSGRDRARHLRPGRRRSSALPRGRRSSRDPRVPRRAGDDRRELLETPGRESVRRADQGLEHHLGRRRGQEGDRPPERGRVPGSRHPRGGRRAITGSARAVQAVRGLVRPGRTEQPDDHPQLDRRGQTDVPRGRR